MPAQKIESDKLRGTSGPIMRPSCVCARRGFIRKFLFIGAALSFVGMMAHTRYYPTGAEISIFAELCDYFFAYLWLVLPVFGILLIPTHTKRGSLLQLVGLLLPLLMTIYTCCAGWNSTPDSMDEFAFALGLFWLSWGGIICFYLPGVLLNYTLFFIEKRRTAEK